MIDRSEKQIVRFLVVGAARSGTTFVMRSLADHADVAVARLEVTPSMLFTIGLGAFVDFEGGFNLKRKFVRSAFDMVCCLCASQSWTAQGATTWAAQGAKTALRDELDARDVVTGLREFLDDLHVVCVQRNDLIAQFASLHLAKLTGRWHVSDRETVPSLPPTRLDVGAFRRYVDDAKKMQACLELIPRTHPTSTVDYERDIAGGRGIRHVFEALDLEPSRQSTGLGLTTPPVETWVENLDELREIVTCSPTIGHEEAESDLRKHREVVLRNENIYFQLERARFLQRVGRSHEAHDRLMVALRGARGPVTRHEAEAFITLASTWPRLDDPALAARSLDELRPRYGDRSEFLEAEAELAFATNNPATVLMLIERARASNPDFSSVQRLDALEQRAHGMQGGHVPRLRAFWAHWKRPK